MVLGIARLRGETDSKMDRGLVQCAYSVNMHILIGLLLLYVVIPHFVPNLYQGSVLFSSVMFLFFDQ